MIVNNLNVQFKVFANIMMMADDYFNVADARNV